MLQNQVGPELGDGLEGGGWGVIWPRAERPPFFFFEKLVFLDSKKNGMTGVPLRCSHSGIFHFGGRIARYFGAGRLLFIF